MIAPQPTKAPLTDQDVATSNYSQSSEEEEEISPLEYARRTGLTCNPRAELPPLSYLAALARDIGESLTDDSHLHQFHFLSYSTDERLSISRDAAQLLACISNAGKEETIDSIGHSLISKKHSKNRRLELPLLKTDHDTDCKEFIKREGFEIRLKDVKLPLEMVDDDENEGLDFPEKFWNKGSEILEQIETEKISVTMDGMKYLQGMLAHDWDEIDEEAIWASVHNYKRVGYVGVTFCQWF
jgi:hypothetical protein